MSAVFSHAIKEGSAPLASNPCQSVSRFKNADKARNQRWSPIDTATFLTAAGWREDKPLASGRDYVGWALLLSIETAMRIGELCRPNVAQNCDQGRRRG